MDINDNANTVRGRYGMACPRCGRDDKLNVVIPCVVRLTPQGGENEQYASDHDIHSETECFCDHCDWVGEAGDAHLDGPQTMDR